MSQERVARQAVAVLVGVAALVAGAGCQHSAFQRLVESSPPDPARVIPATAVATLPPLPSASLPAATPAFDPVPTAAPPMPLVAADTTSLPQTPLVLDEPPAITASATPLLDRALQRAEAQERKRSGQPALVPAVFPPPDRKAAAPRPFPARPPAPKPPAPKPADPKPAPPPLLPPRPVDLVGPPDPAMIRAATVAIEDRTPLTVGEPRLCRKILGYGAFEPIEPGPLHAGQAMLVYCELAGLRFQAREASHVSRLASRVALYTRDGTCVWELALGEAEDECRSRRRDNFLACRLSLPDPLPPGEYRLKLTQTDLVARQSASAELPVSIAR